MPKAGGLGFVLYLGVLGDSKGGGEGVGKGSGGEQERDE